MMNFNNIRSLNDLMIKVDTTDIVVEHDEITAQILANCDAIEEVMEQRQNAMNDMDEIIADIDAIVEEAEKLHTAELLRIKEEEKIECERNIKVLNSILNNPGLIAKYGNKTITRHRDIEPLLRKIPTGCDKSLIQITMDSYGCTYNQALSKLAQKFNINYDHDTWFKIQLEILDHNRKLITNPSEIVQNYPQLWNKMKKDAHMRKYFIFLLDLFQTQLEHNGVSYRKISKPLIASASERFIAKSLRVAYETARTNMNNLTMFGATKKLSDKQVKKNDESRYDNIMNLAGKTNRTITTYELILWDDEVLQMMNDLIIEKQRVRATNKGQCHLMLDSLGHGDVLNKSKRTLTKEEKMIISDLKKWARKKAIDSTGCGFITMDDLNTRLTTIFKRLNIDHHVGARCKDTYISITMSELGLTYEYVSNELKSLINSKKLNKLIHGKVWIHIDIANQLAKYNQ